MSSNKIETMEDGIAPTRVFKYRWIILLIYCLYAGVNFLQFLQYTIIANITEKYYDVGSILVDLTGLVFLASVIILCLPANYLIEKYNLKIVAIFSSGLTTLGNLIKLLSASRDRFYVVIIGQILCAIGQVFILVIPSKLASTWFGPEQVSTACAIAVFGTQIGVALGAIFSSNSVNNSDDMDSVGDDLFTLMIINASITVAMFILVLIFFRARPRVAPSQSQVAIVETEKMTTLEMIKALAKNKDYLLLLVVFGSTNGLYTAFGIIINSVYLHYFPGYEAEIGIITAMAVAAGGCIGSVIFGLILDKYHHFKLTSFFIIISSAITYIFVALSMELDSQLATYFTIPIFGFFIASTLLVGFEFATEVTYPIPEAASCAVLSSFIYLFAIIYSLLADGLFVWIGYIGTHCFVFVVITLGASIIYFISPVLRRREANIKD